MRCRFAALGLSVLLLGGCMSANPGDREVIGALMGAAGGAVLAAKNVGNGTGRTLGIAAGTLLGSWAGADIGRSLDRANAAYESGGPVVRGHSQQVPVPGIAPPIAPAGAGQVWQASAGQAGGTIREARDCRALEGGLRPAFACRNDHGQWFVLQ